MVGILTLVCIQGVRRILLTDHAMRDRDCLFLLHRGTIFGWETGAVTHRAAWRARVRSSTPSFDHATTRRPGEILIQQSTESCPERARQVDPRAAVVVERVDQGFSDQVGVLDRAVLRTRDIRKCVREDFVPRLFAREGCEEDWRGEDDRDDPPVSTMWSCLEGFCS